ncbi:hypothetical protein LCGC14_1349080 [marine sediment metagenome]|uniref:Uncharacterized protein n=1 Tax=marine sediment metagenome TaxID=412755 RepID=A0A0F9KC49_9ZZZZ
MSNLGPWEQAAMDYEVGIFKDCTLGAHFVGGIIMGMAIATRHPEYAQAAVSVSRQRYEKELPDSEDFDIGVENFIRAVPVQVHDEDTDDSSS